MSFSNNLYINNKINQQKQKLPMHQIAQERNYRMLAKPLVSKQNSSPDRNIFASLRNTQHLPSISKIKGKPYDVVGSKQFREKILEPQVQQNHQPVQAQENMMNTARQSNLNSTIKRDTILSKINRQQQNALSKEVKQLNRYKEYKNFWDSESQKIRKKTLRKSKDPTLLETNVKGIYVQQNQDKLDIINNFVVNFWEMSLRNHHKILKRHIKGNKYNEVELQEMLQTDKGIRTVEKSIPVLPIDKLRETKRESLSLTGRNKALNETYRTYRTGLSTDRASSIAQTQNQEEVYKVDYKGNVKWMSMQGL